MWNNGKHLLWQHIVDVYKHNLDNGLHTLPKFSADHILLNSYSVTRVKLAVQVLSDSVADEVSDTSKLCEGCRQPHAGVIAEPLNASKSSAMRRRFDNSQ